MCSVARIRRRCRDGRRRLAVAAIAALSYMTLTSQSLQAASDSAPSAIGDEVPLWMAVSPDYTHTHTIAVLAAAMGCAGQCMHLWVTHDDGASWNDAPLSFDAVHVALLTDGSMHDSIVVASSTLERSDDDGATWQDVGARGVPAPLGGDRVLVAVPGGSDYALTPGGTAPVVGSGGTAVDASFAPSQGGTTLLATSNPRTGADIVERCDASMRCAGLAALPGARGQDLSIALDSRFAEDGIAFTRTATALYRSTDAGRSFVPLPLPSLQAASYTAVAALTTVPSEAIGHDGLVVALLGFVHPAMGPGSTVGGIFRSDDLGATWHTLASGTAFDHGATAVVAAPDGRLFAGYIDARGNAGLECSDDGRTWQARCAVPSNPCAAPCTVVGQVRPADTGRNAAARGSTPVTVAGATPATVASVPTVAQTYGGGDEGMSYPVVAVALAVAVGALAAPVSKLRRRPRS